MRPYHSAVCFLNIMNIYFVGRFGFFLKDTQMHLMCSFMFAIVIAMGTVNTVSCWYKRMSNALIQISNSVLT